MDKRPLINTRPVIGLKDIHERFFVTEDGFEIISLGTLRKWSREMQTSGAIGRIIVRKGGKKSVRIMTLEPFFSLWIQEKFRTKR